MSKRQSGGAADLPPTPERVCVIVVDAFIDELEVDICCERTKGVDHVFFRSMDRLHAERQSKSTLACSVETLLFGVIARCLRFVGEPVGI